MLFELLLKDSGIDVSPLPVIPRRDASMPCFASVAQERLWKAWRSGETRRPNNEVVLLRLSGPLSFNALTRALNEVARRHEILRTRFAEVEGKLCQLISPEMKLEVPVTDLTHASEQEREWRWLRLSREQMEGAFDLGHLPLVRTGLITLGPRAHLLLMTLHRTIFDGWSSNILVNELGQFYEAFITGVPPALIEPEIQYGDYAMWQRARLEAGDLDRDVEYWKRKLGGGPAPLQISPDITAPGTPAEGLASYAMKLAGVASQQVWQVSRSQGLTPYLILMAGWYVLLRRYSGQEEIVVGTVVANRDRAQLQTLIGPVSNTLLLKVDLGGNPSFKEVLLIVKEAAAEAFDHQELPCELVVAEIEKVRNAGDNRLADVMFIFEEGVGEEATFSGLKVIEEKVEGIGGGSDLAISMWSAGGEFEGRIEYSRSLFDEDGIKQLAVRYQRLIEFILADLDCRIMNLPPLAD
jgi:hypothetical protein